LLYKAEQIEELIQFELEVQRRKTYFPNFTIYQFLPIFLALKEEQFQELIQSELEVQRRKTYFPNFTI
jgi:hypothetical protein